MRGAGLLLAFILTLPVATAWDQAHGDMSRNGVATVPAGPLDVIATGQAVPSGWTLRLPRGAGVVPAGDEVAFALQKGGSCEVVLVASFLRNVSRTVPLVPCNAPVVVGYDADRGNLLVIESASASGPGLLAVDPASGAVRWQFSPGAQLPGTDPTEGWRVYGAALDATRGEIALIASGLRVGVGFPVGLDNRVVVIDAKDGRLKWSQAVGGTEGGGGTGVPVPSAASSPTGDLESIAMTPDGVFAMGYREGCATCALTATGSESFLVYYARDGTPGGYLTASTPSPSDARDPSAAASRTPVASEYPVGRGSTVALALGGDVILVNPGDATPVGRAPIRAPELADTSDFLHAGVWTSQAIVLGLRHSIAAFDPVTLQPLWGQSEGPQWDLVDLALDSQGALDTLYFNEGTHETRLLRATTGNVLLGKLPLPIRGPSYQTAMLPTPEGLLVMSFAGDYALLGSSAEALRPDVRLSSAYPALGQLVKADMRAAGPADFAVTWGDGTYEDLHGFHATSATFTHTFVDGGQHDVRVTALYPNGSSATRVMAVDVGGTPPPELTPIQEAFAPENQNLTFGVLGILVTLVGGIFTLARSRRRASILERELGRLDEIADLAARRPRDAARQLREYRDGLRPRLGRGLLDEPQYHVLETRSARLMRALHAKLLDPVAARLSEGFRRRLAAALEDAVIHPAERLGLAEALRGEALEPVERSHLEGVLDDLTSEA